MHTKYYLVKKLFQKILAILLLVTISVTIIPFSYFHHHHHERRLDACSGNGLEACYNSIYKNANQSIESCNHKNHVTSEFEDCIFCSLKFVHLTYHFLPEQNTVHIDYQFSNSYSEADLFPELQFYHKTGNRGPPSQIIS